MRALLYFGGGESAVRDVPDPVRKLGQILLKVMTSALCGSEMKGYLYGEANFDKGWMTGHEMSGEVVDPGESKYFKAGDRAVVQIMNGCGECPYCKAGTYQFCEKLEYENGVHAQYASMPEKCVVKAPNDIDFDMLALLGGDTVGVAYRAAKQLNLAPGKLVFVSGAGPIGLGVTSLLKYYGCEIVVSEPSEYRRHYAQQHAGAGLVLDPAREDVRARLREMTGNTGPEITVECSGNPTAQLQALEYTRCGGTVMLCGENYNRFEIVPSVHIIHKELTVKGAFYFTAADFNEIVKLYHAGLDVSALASHRAALSDAPPIIRAFSQGRTGKVLFHPQES